jgi:hypothetical protein
MADAQFRILVEDDLSNRVLNVHTSCDEGLPCTSVAVESCVAITAAFRPKHRHHGRR